MKLPEVDALIVFLSIFLVMVASVLFMKAGGYI